MRVRPYLDLILVGIFSLLLVPVVMVSDWMSLRIILGLPFVLFFPGFGLLAALFPDRNSLGRIERLTYGIALSVALTGLIGLLLNYVWYIGLNPMLISLLVVIFITSGVGCYRRRQLPTDNLPDFKISLRWRNRPVIDIILVTILILAILGAGAIAVRTYFGNREGYTEFYLLGPGGKAAGYPQSIRVGEPVEVTLVLANRERTAARYMIDTVAENGRVWFDGDEQTTLDLYLEDKQDMTIEIRFAFDSPGDAQKLDFLLYKDGESEKYLEVYLKVDVNP